MRKNKKETYEFSAEEKALRAEKKKNIIAFAVCVLIGFLLWLVIMNVDMSGAPTDGDAALSGVLMNVSRIGL